MTNEQLINKLNSLHACISSIEWLEDRNAEQMWNDCHRGDWMLWLLQKLDLDNRKLTLCKGKCAETVKHLMKDERSINAVEVAIRYGYSEATDEELTAATAAAAYAAAAATAYAAYAAAAATAAYTAAAADAAAAAATAAYTAAAADAARKANQQQTSEIIRSIVTYDELLTLLNK